MMSDLFRNIEQSWSVIGPLLSLRNEAEYDQAIERLNYLLDEIGTDEAHPLYSFLDILGTLVWVYENEHYPIPDLPELESS